MKTRKGMETHKGQGYGIPSHEYKAIRISEIIKNLETTIKLMGDLPAYLFCDCCGYVPVDIMLLEDLMIEYHKGRNKDIEIPTRITFKCDAIKKGKEK